MSYLIAFTRKMVLTSYIHHLETKMTDITEKKLKLTDNIADLTTQISDIGDSDSPAVKKLEARKIELENLDKKMDMKMQKYQTQLQAANTNLQSAEQMLQQNIQKSFSYTGG